MAGRNKANKLMLYINQQKFSKMDDLAKFLRVTVLEGRLL
jgi:hypothetical protein